MSLNAAIIDRDPNTVAVILERLSAAGMTGQACSAAGFADIQGQVGLVFVDLYNPEKEGIAAIMELRARWPGLTIVAMAPPLRGVPAGAVLDLALGLGADHGLAKPIAPVAIDAVLAKILARQGAPESGDAEPRCAPPHRPRQRDRRPRGGSPAGLRRLNAEPAAGF